MAAFIALAGLMVDIIATVSVKTVDKWRRRKQNTVPSTRGEEAPG